MKVTLLIKNTIYLHKIPYFHHFQAYAICPADRWKKKTFYGTSMKLSIKEERTSKTDFR